MFVVVLVAFVINARRMGTRVTVCVCVLLVCFNTFNMAIGFSLGLSDFQLTDLSKMPSFPAVVINTSVY